MDECSECEKEIPQITEKNLVETSNRDESYSGSSAASERAYNQGEVSLISGGLGLEMQNCKIIIKNGEESDGQGEGDKISLIIQESNSNASDCCRYDKNSNFLENGQAHGIEIKSDGIDLSDGNVVEVFDKLDRDQDVSNDEADEDIRKEIEMDNGQTFVSGLSVAGSSDCKEVSVQTSLDEFFISEDSCYLCSFHKGILKNDSTALGLRFPPCKRRRIHRTDFGSRSNAELGIVDENSDDSEEPRPSKVSPNDDHVVPGFISHVDFVNGSKTDYISRPIRVGLSKRAKLQPLHQVPKFQATNTAVIDS